MFQFSQDKTTPQCEGRTNHREKGVFSNAWEFVSAGASRSHDLRVVSASLSEIVILCVAIGGAILLILLVVMMGVFVRRSHRRRNNPEQNHMILRQEQKVLTGWWGLRSERSDELCFWNHFTSQTHTHVVSLDISLIVRSFLELGDVPSSVTH